MAGRYHPVPRVAPSACPEVWPQGALPCLLCGAPVADGEGFDVILGADGLLLIHPEEAERDRDLDRRGHLGAQPLGTECVRHVPPEFRLAAEPAAGRRPSVASRGARVPNWQAAT